MPNNYIDINGAQTLYNDLRGRAARAGGNLAAEYSTSATYSVGDYVIYKDKLYRCKTAVTTAGSWASNSSKFEVTNIGEETSALKSAFALFQENIPGTVQTIAFDSAGNVQSITHMEGTTAVRTDVFTFGTSTITEVRTLATGESLTIVTNTDTLETTTTYADAA